jgi:hypothetical protein
MCTFAKSTICLQKYLRVLFQTFSALELSQKLTEKVQKIWQKHKTAIKITIFRYYCRTYSYGSTEERRSITALTLSSRAGIFIQSMGLGTEEE